MITIAAGALGIAVLCAAAKGFVPFFADDGFISLRYAERFAHGLGLTWTEGEHVEGYSNLTWVLLTALVGRLLDDFVAAARFVGIVGMALAAGAILGYRGARTGREVAAGVLGMATVVVTPAIAVWAIGGLEQPLVAACLALGLGPVLSGSVDLSRWRRNVARCAFAFLVVTRPDGILMVSLAAAALLFEALLSTTRSPRIGQLVRLVAPAILVWLAQLGFRRLYYHDWIPNPAYAKVALTRERVAQGLGYVAGAAVAMPIIVAGTAMGLILLGTKARRRVAVVLAVHVGWASYVAIIGGDIFPARRHAVPLVITSALLLAEGLWLSLGTRLGPLLAPIVMLVCGGAMARGARPDPEVARAHDERWEWAAEPTGLLMRRAFAGRDPLLATDPAGCMPFFTGFRALDMLGLNDRYLAHHRPLDFGKGPLAHELGDGRYVFARQPDVILFCLPWGSEGACFRGGQELLAQEGFHDAYTLVDLEAREPRPERSRLWFRREGRLGVSRTAKTVEVPAWLWGAPEGAPIRPGADGELEAEVTSAHPRVYPGLALPGGHWRAEIVGTGRMYVRAELAAEPRREGPRPPVAEIAVTEGAKVDLTISLADARPEAAPAALRTLILRREPPHPAGHPDALPGGEPRIVSANRGL